MTTSAPAIDVNLSSLLFRETSTNDADKTAKAFYTGPIRVVTNGTNAVAHGRGVVATRDIQAGECLFVTPPAATANVQRVTQLWRKKVDKEVEVERAVDGVVGEAGGSSSSETKLVEQLSEQVLVQEMERALKETPEKARSFLALMGASDSSDNENETSMERLMGNEKMGSADNEKKEDDVAIDPTRISKEDLCQIVRRNAFGPDFRTFDYIERRWLQDAATAADNATEGTEGSHKESFFAPSRLLGMYPLAAMLNHSCVPNAVRVFSGDVMVAHANTTITEGQEIVWSYLPPTQPYPARSDTLKHRYGFECQCERCAVEGAAWNYKKAGNDGNGKDASSCAAELLQESYEFVAHLNQSNLDISALDNQGYDALTTAVQKLKDDIMSNKSFSNELRRYVRLGYMHLYMNYLNASLAAVRVHSEEDATAVKNGLLGTCMELHFAFCECHNASTEHLSILHLCYELVGSMHTTAVDQTKSLPKLQFWTEQMKRAHMIRYGSLGNDLDSVRKVMQHTRTVLRNRDGMERVSYSFI